MLDVDGPPSTAPLAVARIPLGDSRVVAGEVEALRSRVVQLEAERANWQEERSQCRLVWEDRPDPGFVAARERLPLLVEEPSLAIGAGDHPHLLIEGDNYHALLELTYTHRGQVDVIYIDPPYSTNSAAIPYDDNFDHSTWLSLMEPRLLLARDLLAPDGFLAASIDDNEMPRLVLLLERVFGAGSTKVVVVKMSEASGVKMAHARRGGLPKLKEYLVLAMAGGVRGLLLDPIPKEAWDEEYHQFLDGLTEAGRSQIDGVEDLAADGTPPSDDDLARLEDEVLSNLRPISVAKAASRDGVDARDKGQARAFQQWRLANAWRICQFVTGESVKLLVEARKAQRSGQVLAVRSRTGLLYIARREGRRQQMLFADKYLTTHPGDLWTDFRTTGLEAEGGVVFKNGKKPLALLRRIIKAHPKKDALVLDFFAGSGSTGHAVLELNREDGGTRRFVLVTSNEAETDDRGRPTGRLICRDICYRRLHNVMVGYERGKTHVAELGGSLRYLVADRVGLSAADALIPDRASQVVAALAEDTLRVRADCFRLVERRPEFVVFESGQRLLAILHRYSTRAALVGVLKPIVGDREVHIYPFAPENVADTKWFRDQLGERTLVMRLPDEITHTYERLILGARRA